MTIKFKTDVDIIHPYTFDSSNLKGYADKLFLPENIEDLKTYLEYLYENDNPVTTSGAGTGITGGRVPQGGAVISTEKFKSISILSEGVVSAGAAVTLDELDIFLHEHNLFLPVNPTEINASIGGNAATNASGARTFKYGPIRDYITGIKVVLAGGDIITLKRGDVFANGFDLILNSDSGREFNLQIPTYKMPQVKNASGYFAKENMDAIDLLIGSEGTLCIFAEIELKVLPRPDSVLGGVVFFDDISKLLDFLIEIRDKSRINNKISVSENNGLSARLIEYFDKQSLNLLRPKYSEIPLNAVGAVWFEQEFDLKFEEKIINDWYEIIQKFSDLSDNTWFAQNDKEHLKLKEFRHELPLQVYENLTNNSQKKVGLDTAVPDSEFPLLFNYYLENFSKINLEYVVFGHIGNSHLHANIFCRNDDEYKIALEFYDRSIELALSLGGTVSAEHGIGKLKKPYLEKMYGKSAIDEMRAVKRVLDDKWILNKGTMFDE